MPKHTKTSSALVVLSDRELSYNEEQLPKLQAAALEQIAMVGSLHREAAARAILAGLTLHRVKASLKHGGFLPWLKANVKGAGYSQCNFYMRLAGAFIEHAKVTKPDLLAMPGDQIALALDGEGESRNFLGKLSKFVGNNSLSSLLDKYGIKSTKALGGSRETEESAPLPVVTDPEVIRLQSMDEIGTSFGRVRALLIQENRLQYFVGHADQIKSIVDGFRSLADDIEKAAKPLLSKAS